MSKLPFSSGQKPKPFVRPGIELSTTIGQKKEWRRVAVESVRSGDIVRSLGLVVSGAWQTGNPSGGRLYFQNGKYEDYNWGDKVTAFTAAEGEPVG